MKRIRLIDLEGNNYQFHLFELVVELMSFEISIMKVKREVWCDGGVNHWTTVPWVLFAFVGYSKHSLSTVRADVWFWGKQYRWDRKVEPVGDDLPF